MKKIDIKKILEKFKVTDKNLFYKDLIKLLSIVILIFIIINISIYLYVNNKIKSSFENSTISKVSLNDKFVFNIEKIVLFSSGYATTNDTNLDMWNLNVSQYTDIAIYINNNIKNGLTDENIIKTLSISNIKFEPKLQLGTPILNYKNIYSFGKYTDIENADSLDFNVIDYNSQIDYNSPQIYNSLQNPITLGYINKDIKTDYSLISNQQILSFDGSILKKCNILLSDISTNISFDIKITNNLNQEFVRTISIPIPLENIENNSNIYNGNITKALNYTNKYIFYRIK